MAAPNIHSSNNPMKGLGLIEVMTVTGPSWSSVAANTTAAQSMTVTGVAVGDFVYVNKPTTQAGIGICGARVSAADTVSVTWNNNTAGGITPTASESYTVLVVRPFTSLTAVESMPSPF